MLKKSCYIVVFVLSFISFIKMDPVFSSGSSHSDSSDIDDELKANHCNLSNPEDGKELPSTPITSAYLKTSSSSVKLKQTLKRTIHRTFPWKSYKH